MKIMVEVEFEVEVNDPDIEDGDEMSEQDAMEGVESAVFNHLVFTQTGRDVVDSVEVHAEGFGNVLVSLCE